MRSVRCELVRVADDFWNIRGSFKVGGIIDVGTQCSMVKLASGKFVMVDSYPLSGEAERDVLSVTGAGENVEAVLNVHPFHTVHVEAIHAQFPNARLYGTARHLKRFSQLPWQTETTDSEALHARYADDFAFSVPDGVDFISKNPNVHFSSVLVFHKRSKTIHVDDTLMHLRFPTLLGSLGLPERTSFHPTLRQALERRAGAAERFRQWARALAEEWADAKNLCAAHTAPLLERHNRDATIQQRILTALDRAERTLAAHERKYGR